jgi:SAM-dependent methyltransferase
VSSSRRHFETGGDAYRKHRPVYPRELALFLAGLAPDHELAVDVACGSGQLTGLLAEHFDDVHAFDISADQVANAAPHPRVRYGVAAADDLPVEEGTASLVTIAQAAHWLDLPPFYAEVRRIARPGAVFALITYLPPVLEGTLGPRFFAFYGQDLGAWWPPGREHVIRGGIDLPFPYAELPVPRFRIDRDWSLPEFLGYIETWSATKRARANGHADTIDAFRDEAREGWGEPQATKRITWPVNLRAARVSDEVRPRKDSRRGA